MPEHNPVWIPADEIKRVIDMPFKLDHALKQLGGTKRGVCRIAENVGGSRIEVQHYILQALLDRGFVNLKPQPAAYNAGKSINDPAAFVAKYRLQLSNSA